MNIRNIVRGLLGALFCWAALSKLGNPTDFFGNLLSYKLPLSDSLLRVTAIVLPWLELLCGLMLLTSFQLRAAVNWCLLLFGIFVVATGQAWARGLDISCGCFKLSVIGVDAMESFGKIIESAPGAFFRALLLLAATFWLWRATSPVPVQTKK